MSCSHPIQVPVLPLPCFFLCLWYAAVIRHSCPIRSSIRIRRLTKIGLLANSTSCSLLRVQRLMLKVWLLVVHMPCRDETLYKYSHDYNHWPHEYYYSAPTRWWCGIRMDCDHLEVEKCYCKLNGKSCQPHSPI